MDVSETKLSTPKEFPFPFVPYSIQEDFMQSLYEALEDRKLGIFESPTGTGKSMSLICGSLKWLVDAEERFKKDIELKITKLNDDLKTASTEKDWFEEHSKQTKKRQERDRLQVLQKKIVEFEKKISEIEKKNKVIKENEKKVFDGNKCKTQRKTSIKTEVNFIEECENDYEECDLILDNSTDFGEITFEDLDHNIENREKCNGIKVIFCSRTHSQLTQLVNEIIKSPYKDLKVRVVTLASRLNYCVNESVGKLKNLSLINEKCLELQKNKSKVTKFSSEGEQIKKQRIKTGCVYHKQSNVENLKIKILSDIHDTESLINLGKQFEGCPYYASRHALDEAQVVITPYSTLLHKSTRLACGISLKDSVVIIDEAHNLLDCIGNIYNSVLSGQELILSQSILNQYKIKYNERLSALNLLHLNQLLFIINRLIKRICDNGEGQPKILNKVENKTTVESLAEFILSCEIDSINLHKILEFAKSSNLVLKLQGFVEKEEPLVSVFKKEIKGISAFLKTISSKRVFHEGEIAEDNVVNKNCILNVMNFIQSLTNHCSDGRVIINQSTTIAKSTLKFLLLNPASQFTDIVEEARSVIVAGGTMQPFTEFTNQLFLLAGGVPERILTFACDHIIPPNNILPVIVSEGPSGRSLDFSFKKRKSSECLDELGRILTNVSNVVPAGIVCFFPSYEYENVAFTHWEKTGVIGKIQQKKKVLREPKKSSQVEEVLSKYGNSARKDGAILMSVVGGKLSEGLNFSDDLGRCIIIVGLPYPNSGSPELKEKINYLNSTVGSNAGKVYYENLCMKSVNQSIGRSVRHKEDYACVLLIDRRYSRTSCVKALPAWIQKSLRIEPKFGPVIGLISKFFVSKKKKNNLNY